MSFIRVHNTNQVLTSAGRVDSGGVNCIAELKYHHENTHPDSESLQVLHFDDFTPKKG